MIEGAKDVNEVLVGLSLMKRWDVKHERFPFESVTQYVETK